MWWVNKVAPQNSQVAPQNSQVAPQNSQVAPQNSQVAPQNGGLAPQIVLIVREILIKYTVGSLVSPYFRVICL
jgi:hypothetical protein